MTFAEQQYRALLERQKRLGKTVRRRPTPAPPSVSSAASAAERIKLVEALQKEVAQLSTRLNALAREEQTPLVLPSRAKPIIRAVAAYYRVPLNDLVSSRHERKLIRPRHVAMYLAKELTGYSPPAIGRLLARSHTTVLAACQNIAKQRLQDAELDAEIRTLTAQLSLENPQ